MADPLQENLLLELLNKTVPEPIVAGVADWVAKLKNPFPPVPVIAKDVALATPKVGVVNVGEVANTTFPVPVVVLHLTPKAEAASAVKTDPSVPAERTPFELDAEET